MHATGSWGELISCSFLMVLCSLSWCIKSIYVYLHFSFEWWNVGCCDRVDGFCRPCAWINSISWMSLVEGMLCETEVFQSATREMSLLWFYFGSISDSASNVSLYWLFEFALTRQDRSRPVVTIILGNDCSWMTAIQFEPCTFSYTNWPRRCL